MLRHKLTSVFLFAAICIIPSYSFSAELGVDRLVSALSEPAGWRALGTIKPGTEGGVDHNVYANSALLAAILKGQGVEVPYKNLTNDPATAMDAFSEYLGRIPDNKLSVNEETCGIAVSHLYGLVFSQMLIAKGPKWALPGISDAEALGKARQAEKNFKEFRDLAADMCDSWEYRRVTKAFDELLVRVSGEMPYLLNTALPQAQTRESREIAASKAAELEAEKIAKSKLLGPPMLAALSGVTPAITSDPFSKCLEMGQDFIGSPKYTCLLDVPNAARASYYKLFESQQVNVAKARANRNVMDRDKHELAAMQKCRNEGSNTEESARCQYVYYKLQEFSLSQSPLKTNEQVASEHLGSAHAIAKKHSSTSVIPEQEKNEYLRLMTESSNLGNIEAKVQLADFYSKDMSNIGNLAIAEKLLDEVEQLHGATEQTRKLLSKITPTLESERFANKPENRRATLRSQAQGSKDDAVKAALTLDNMSRPGTGCDVVVIKGYDIANNTDIEISYRLKVVIENITDTLFKIGCLY